jgi:hypothetical protein
LLDCEALLLELPLCALLLKRGEALPPLASSDALLPVLAALLPELPPGWRSSPLERWSPC